MIFWQQYISMPLFIRKYVNPNADVDLLLSVDAIIVICFQIAVTYVSRKLPAFTAMTLGFLITSLAWVIPALHPTVPMFVVALVLVALGEITQVSRYYEYISRLAPAGQQGLYMGFAFLPIGIGYLIGGRLGGYLVHHYGEVAASSATNVVGHCRRGDFYNRADDSLRQDRKAGNSGLDGRLAHAARFSSPSA